ncbi:MAG: ATP-binding protein [Acidobacteriota bacterium]|nr:ATP-binding protein [Acidobacteriota bacterium]MDE3171132.1 ATP-binding protein [Acidobacteriota bacterium]
MSVHPEEIARIEGKFHADPRLIAGAMAIVTHVARRAGFAETAAAELRIAATEACNAFAEVLGARANSSSEIQLAASEFPGHIEVAVNFAPGEPGAGNPHDVPLKPDLAARLREELANAPVDAMNAAIENGYPKITLIKNCRAAKRRFDL